MFLSWLLPLSEHRSHKYCIQTKSVYPKLIQDTLPYQNNWRGESCFDLFSITLRIQTHIHTHTHAHTPTHPTAVIPFSANNGHIRAIYAMQQSSKSPIPITNAQVCSRHEWVCIYKTTLPTRVFQIILLWLSVGNVIAGHHNANSEKSTFYSWALFLVFASN